MATWSSTLQRSEKRFEGEGGCEFHWFTSRRSLQAHESIGDIILQAQSLDPIDPALVGQARVVLLVKAVEPAPILLAWAASAMAVWHKSAETAPWPHVQVGAKARELCEDIAAFKVLERATSRRGTPCGLFFVGKKKQCSFPKSGFLGPNAPANTLLERRGSPFRLFGLDTLLALWSSMWLTLDTTLKFDPRGYLI